MKKLVQLLLLAALLLPITAQAKLASQVAADYYNALKRSDYPAAASFYDRNALREFRSMMSFINELPPQTSLQVYKKLFGDSATKLSVNALNDVDFFAAFLGAMMANVQAQTKLSFDQLQIIGEVIEGPMVHVVTRNKVSAGTLKVEAMEVISLKRTSKRWRILMSGRIKGMAESIRQSLKASK